jgi:hypothetical protein
MTEIVNPFAHFFDTSGAPLNNGIIYIGAANLDAQTNPIPVYWDEGLTIPAAQPIRTLNGYVVRNGTPARIFCNVNNFSMTVQTNTGRTVWATQDAKEKLRDSVNVRDFGAKCDGVTNDLPAWQAAAAYAKSIGGAIVNVPPGKHLLYGGTISAERVAFVGPGVGRRNVADYSEVGGATVLVTDTVNSLFQTSNAGGVLLEGLAFYWPNQSVDTTPFAYPALITGQSGQQMVDWTMRDCYIVNAYDVVNVPSTITAIGALRFDDCKIYAIRSFMRFFYGAPEVIHVNRCDFTPGQFQNIATFAHGGFLRNWTGNNGSLFYVDIGASGKVSIDGLSFTNNLVYGYRYAFNVVSGRLDLPTIATSTFDATPTVLRVAGAAGIVSGNMGDGNVYYGIRADGSASNDFLFDIQTSGLVRAKLGGVVAYCNGSALVVNAANADMIEWTGTVYAWGQASGLAVDAYAAYINAPIATVRLDGVWRGEYPNSIGVFLSSARSAVITGGFDACKVALIIDTGYLGKWVAYITAQNTGSSNPIECRAANTGQAFGMYDKVPTGFSPRFGFFTSNADAAVTGYITIIDEAGNTRKLATIA